ncbi:autotransporter domain-containing protein, partial [Phascolarctobacterium faecium]|uniref:autotransporter domain-containing protein n=1 Tax=Phascolarctobacterium faecium TaxID=33025 RepID=UPI0040274A94
TESKNKQSQFSGINVQFDPDDNNATIVVFNGGKTDIKVEGKATWFAAVQGSGVPGSINFTGKKVNITAVNNKAVREGDSTTVGIYAQYGATINSVAATDIVTTVEANGYANGIYNTNNFSYNGNVKLKGNFMGTVISNESSAYGIYNDPLAADNTGGEVYIGKGLKLDVTALKGEAVGIYGEGEHSKTTVLGDVIITTNGQNDSYSLYAAAKANITLGSAGKTVALTGDVTAKDADSIITLAGDSNVVKGTVTADAGGIVLGGGDKATYTVDKFVTKGAGERASAAVSGTITVSGGTLNIDNLSDINKFDLADNSLIVTGKGVLKAASDKVFEADTSGKKVIAGVDQKVLFNGGKLAISDTSYTLADSKVYSEALGKVDDSGVGANTKTTIVMTGTLQDQPVDNKATVDDLAPTGAVHTNVTGTVSTGTLNVGDDISSEGATGVNNDLGVKDLDFSSNSGTVDASVTISNDTGLTLVGDGSSELLKGTGSNNTVTVGSNSDSAGTLTLGNAAAESSGGTLNANVTLQSDSQMTVEAGSFTVDKITATEGTVAVNAGADLTTMQDFTVGDAINNKTGTIDAAGSITAGKVDLQQGTVAVTGSLTANELSVGTSKKEGTVTAAGTVDVGTLNLNRGKVEVTGALAAETLTVADNSGASIAVGAADSAGTLTAKNVQLGGTSLMLDPAWKDGSMIQTASKAGLKFNGNQVDGKLTVGQNSVLSLGTADTAKAEAAFADTGLTWGQNDITAALYIDYEQTMDSTKGGIKVDGSLTHVSDSKDLAAANTATFAAGSLLMVAGDAALTMDGALKAGGTATITISNGSAATLKVDSGAKLYIADAQADKQYTIVSGFTNSGSDVTDGGWNGTNLLLNKLVKGSGSYSSGSFTVSTQKVKASEALPGVALPNILDAMSSQTDSPYAGIKYLSNAISGLNSNAQTLVAVNSFAQGAENSGATRTGALAALDLGTAVQEHLSLAKAAAEQSGGFGKAAVDTADNGGIWAQYIHNKDKVDNMGGVSYDGQYNGVIIGGDFTDRGKYSSGIAFSYGSGDSTGSASKNEFDFWGLSYYGGIQNGDTNLIFDVGYSKTSSDVKGVIKAEPDTQVISMGIKGEKVISNGHGTSYVPYAGLRYMNIDTDSYNGSIDGKTAAHYSTDKADLWLLPVGISISHESVTAGGWKVRPTADIAYVWTLGDKNTAMDITVPGVNATDRLGYDIMDSGFFVGKLGLEAEKGDWTYGLGYACQKGSHAQNSKFMLNVTYSF